MDEQHDGHDGITEDEGEMRRLVTTQTHSKWYRVSDNTEDEGDEKRSGR